MPATADVPKLAGKFAFRTDLKLDQTACVKLTAKDAAQIAAQGYKCESAPLSSGQRALLCSAPNGKRGYMIFDAKKACDSERKDEAAAE